MSTRIVLPLVGLCMAASIVSARAAKLDIQEGGQNSVCKAAARIAAQLSETDFWGGGWRQAFGAVNWIEDSYPTITAEGREHRVVYSRVMIDIDNDGGRDVVIRYTDMQGSVLWDWVYVVPPSEFQAAKKQDGVVKLLQTAPQLNPDNSVQFTNGSGGVPVEFQIWNHAKTNYIVLKEHFFLKRQPSLPSSLLVARVQSPSSSPSTDVGSRRPPVELICRIRGR